MRCAAAKIHRAHVSGSSGRDEALDPRASMTRMVTVADTGYWKKTSRSSVSFRARRPCSHTGNHHGTFGCRGGERVFFIMTCVLLQQYVGSERANVRGFKN